MKDKIVVDFPKDCWLRSLKPHRLEIRQAYLFDKLVADRGGAKKASGLALRSVSAVQHCFILNGRKYSRRGGPGQIPF
jgi:hypothetical protein